MKKFFCFSVLILIFAVFLCSCHLKHIGESPSAFIERLNNYDENYNVPLTGFLADTEKMTLTKFFSFPENEIMLQLRYNEANKIYSINIVLDNISENNTEELNFIENVIKAFINDEHVTKELLTTIDEQELLFQKEIALHSKKIGNVQLLVDVTEIGTVITVLQNTP